MNEAKQERVESCGRCRFFEPFASNTHGDYAGACRRYPPQLSSALQHAGAAPVDDVLKWDEVFDRRDDAMNWQFQTVYGDADWCGEFSAK